MIPIPDNFSCSALSESVAGLERGVKWCANPGTAIYARRAIPETKHLERTRCRVALVRRMSNANNFVILNGRRWRTILELFCSARHEEFRSAESRTRPTRNRDRPQLREGMGIMSPISPNYRVSLRGFTPIPIPSDSSCSATGFPVPAAIGGRWKSEYMVPKHGNSSSLALWERKNTCTIPTLSQKRVVTPQNLKYGLFLNRRGGGIRTPGPLLPKQIKRFIEAY